MAKITALIHAYAEHADALRLERALDSLRPCSQVVVINHGNAAEIDKVAREHGATVKAGVPGVSPGAYLVDASNDWIFCLRPNEVLSEALEASLSEWKDEDRSDVNAFAVRIREQNGNGWHYRPAETRLVNRKRVNWTGELPPPDPKAEKLGGDLLRYSNP